MGDEGISDFNMKGRKERKLRVSVSSMIIKHLSTELYISIQRSLLSADGYLIIKPNKLIDLYKRS